MTSELTTEQQALIALRRMRAKLERMEQMRNEPIAVIGAACRFPGQVVDLESYWNLLIDGRDAIRRVPETRWPSPIVSGQPDLDAIVRRLGYLENVDRFDAAFFGISPREANLMDPQQRLLLETAWEALEHAGLTNNDVSKSQTGVFVGISNSDYLILHGEDCDSQHIDSYYGSGMSHGMAAGRLAYVLGLEGPTMAIDTACSSSLVAVHLACQSLRNDECSSAIAAGVNLVLTPKVSIALARAGMLSSNGRCSTFDGSADGFVRAEGCGVVILKRLSQATQDGDAILAVIRGSAVNQDGRSNGLTAPSESAQEAVIRAALSRARVAPSEIGYVEAHGTGTPLGDPIELRALAHVLGNNERPLNIGSVKANLGHLESAAGIAGLLKSILILQRSIIPPQIHFETPNPHVDWRQMPLKICTESVSWNDEDCPLASVSSFGFSGTNAHVILERPPRERCGLDHNLARPLVVRERPTHLLCLSAGHSSALTELAMRFRDFLDVNTRDFADIAFTANACRTHFKHRLAITANSSTQAKQRLEAFLRSESHPDVQVGESNSRERMGIAFVLGATANKLPDATSWKELNATELALRDVLTECDEINQSQMGQGLVSSWLESRTKISTGSSNSNRLWFCLQLALCRLWQKWGIEPTDMIGEGVGEYVSACVAGSLSLNLALELASNSNLDRTRLQARLNEPTRCPPTLRWIAVNTDNSSHTANSIWRRPSHTVPNIYQGIRLAHDQGCNHFLSFGPDLEEQRLSNGDPTDESDLRQLSLLPCWPDGKDFRRQFTAGLAKLYVTGFKIDWKHGEEGHSRKKRVLPNYPFQRRRHWFTPDKTPARPEPVEHEFSSQESPGDWLYQEQWQKTPPNSNQTPIPLSISSADIANRVSNSIPKLERQGDIAVYADFLPALDLLCRVYVCKAITDLGFAWEIGDTFTAETLASRLNIASRNRRPWRRMLDMLCADGILSKTGSRWRLLRRPKTEDPHSIDVRLARDYPACTAELDLLRSFGLRLRDLLCGDCDPLDLLCPGGDATLISKFYSESPFARFYNSLICQFVSELLKGVQANRPIRILEVGAGTGGTTSAVLPALANYPVEYVCTDVSPFLMSFVEKRFAEFSQVSFTTMDVECDPEQQGFITDSFDVILAANVVHATADIQSTLLNLRKLLTPDGKLILLEANSASRFADLTVGLTDGWWKFTDSDIRKDYPLLSRADWRKQLEAAGFRDLQMLPPESTDRGPDNAVMMASRRDTQPRIDTDDHDRSSAWVVFAPHAKHGLALQVVELLNSRGKCCYVVSADPEAASSNPRELSIDPKVYEDYVDAFQMLATEHRQINILNLWPLSWPPVVDSQENKLLDRQVERCGSVISLLQAVHELESQNHRIWFVTRGAQVVSPGDHQVEIGQSSVWGIGRVAMLEFPKTFAGIIDLSLDERENDAEILVQHVLNRSQEDAVAIRDEQIHVARLVSTKPGTLPKTEFRLRPDASYLITGGLGRLGMKLAKRWIQKGAQHIIVTGRTSLPDESDWPNIDRMSKVGRRVEALQELNRHGPLVSYQCVDVANSEQMTDLFDEIDGSPWPLRGVAHLAGDLEERRIDELDSASLNNVLRAKLAGAWCLHQLSLNLEIDFMVLFSSAAAIWGGEGFASYAAANAFLDALAHLRRSQQRHGLSVNWARWGTGADEFENYFERIGLGVMHSEQALDVLEHLLMTDATQHTVAAVDWNTFQQVYQARRYRPFFDAIADSDKRQSKPSDRQPHCVEDLSAAAPSDRQSRLLAQLLRQVSEITQIPQSEIDSQCPLFEMGFDSLMAVQLGNRLRSELEIEIAVSHIIDAKNLDELAERLVAKVEECNTKKLSASDLLAKLDEMPDEQVDALLQGFESQVEENE